MISRDVNRNVIKVPKVKGPKGVCWKEKEDPPGVIHFHLGHCTFKKGHAGKCQWDTP